MLCNKKATKQGRRKKKLNKTIGGAVTTNVAPPLGVSKSIFAYQFIKVS
jgi:hypothetical protein